MFGSYVFKLEFGLSVEIGLNNKFKILLWTKQTIFNPNLAFSSRIFSGKAKLQACRKKKDKYLDYGG